MPKTMTKYQLEHFKDNPNCDKNAYVKNHIKDNNWARLTVRNKVRNQLLIYLYPKTVPFHPQRRKGLTSGHPETT